MSRFTQKFGFGMASVLAAVVFTHSDAQAQVNIVRIQGPGAAPASTAGGGDLPTIFNAACDWWEAELVTTPYTLTITYSWDALGGSTLGVHSLTAQGGTPNRETACTIRFDNDGSSTWFMDPTPCDNSEYSAGPLLSSASFGGGTMNTGRRYNSATGSAVGRTDMFTVCLHEIGHALGLSSANTSFTAENGDLDIDVTAPRPFPGSSIPTISGAHLNVTNTLMFPSVSSGLRRLPTEADAVSNAQISQMTGINSITACPGSGPTGSPLTTTFADNNGGGVGGAVYFSLEALAGSTGVTITDIDLNCGGAGGVAASVDVYLQTGCTFDHLGSWIGPVATGTGTTAAAGSPSNFVLNTPVEFGEGCCYGVALVANGFGHRYTTATGLPLVYSTADLELTGGTASNVAFAGSAFSPRLVNTNIHYTVGGSCLPLAETEAYGNGCKGEFTSFYEVMSPTGMDLAGQQVRCVNGPTGYTVTVEPSFLAPIGTLDPAAVPLALGDDDSTPAGTLGLEVFSNGQVARGAGNSTSWAPSTTTMLGNPAEAMYAWTDLQPNAAGSGLVTYEEGGPGGTFWQVTYDGVWLWNTTDAVTIQIRGNEASGTFIIAFGALATTGPEDWLVGYSTAGASDDPGGTDLTAAILFPITTSTVDVLPLGLEGVGTPVLGAPFSLTTTNIEPGAVFHVGIIGLTQVGLPLSFVIPSADPQCSVNASMDLIHGPDVVFGGTGSFTWPGIDLTGASLIGFDIFFQSATLDLSVLSATTRTSNGLRATTGL